MKYCQVLLLRRARLIKIDFSTFLDLLTDNMTYFIYTVLCLIWGSTWLAIKIGLEDSPPFWSAGIRFAIASVIIILANRFRTCEYPKNMKEIAHVALPGLFMYGLSYMFVYWAEVHISSSLTAFLFASFPFFVAGFSIVMLKEERLNMIGWIGLIIGFIGIIFVFYDSLAQSRFMFWGVLMVVLGAAVAAFGSVYIRAYLRKYDVAVLAEIQMPAGAALIIIMALIFEPVSAFKITFNSVTALIYLAVFGSVIAFLGYYWLLKKMEAIKVAQIAFITPFVAFALGYFVRYETFNLFTIIGSLLIIIGVIMVVRK